MRRSISWLPGNGTSCSVVSVLTYGVFAVNGSLMPRRRACSLSCSSSCPARAGPFDLQHVVERIQPLGGFDGLEIGDVVGGDVSHSWFSRFRAARPQF